jgi:hypothetical protein
MFPPSSLSSRDEKEMEYIFKADELKTGCFPIVKTETTVLWKKATSYFKGLQTDFLGACVKQQFSNQEFATLFRFIKLWRKGF